MAYSSITNSTPPSVDTARPTSYLDLNGIQSIRQSENQDEALRKVAEQFESMFISLMLKNMRSANAVFEEDSIFKSNESDFYRDMHDNQLALTMANGRGLGIADALYRQMNQNYGNAELDSGSENPVSVDSSNLGTNKISDRVAIANDERDFVNKVLPHAVDAAKKIGVDPLALIAQSALETGWGKQVLADDMGRSSNNLFNIKTGSSWQGSELSKSSLEYKNGVLGKEYSTFRQYENIADSFEDYASFITEQDRYSKNLHAQQSSEDYIKQLHSAGYATDPNYSKKVISVLHRVETIVSQPNSLERS